MSITPPLLTFDRYGVYLWTPRFVIHFMWNVRFWELQRQVFWDYERDCVDKYYGNFSLGPLYVAWYPRSAWEQ